MKKIIVTTCMLMALVACSSMTVSERETKRNELDEMAAKTIAGLVEDDDTLQQQVDNAPGYAVANMKVTKVPIVGAGGGEGVFVNQKTNKRTYFTVSRLDIGGGWGARSYKTLLIFEDEKTMGEWKGGKWEFAAGVEASAGTAAAEGASGSNEGFTMHVLSDGGASATATARVIRIKVNSELSETP